MVWSAIARPQRRDSPDAVDLERVARGRLSKLAAPPWLTSTCRPERIASISSGSCARNYVWSDPSRLVVNQARTWI